MLFLDFRNLGYRDSLGYGSLRTAKNRQFLFYLYGGERGEALLYTIYVYYVVVCYLAL